MSSGTVDAGAGRRRQRQPVVGMAANDRQFYSGEPVPIGKAVAGCKMLKDAPGGTLVLVAAIGKGLCPPARPLAAALVR